MENVSDRPEQNLEADEAGYSGFTLAVGLRYRP